METQSDTTKLPQPSSQELDEKVRAAFDAFKANADSPDYLQAQAALVKDAAENPASLKDQQTLDALGIALLTLAAKGEKSVFPSLYQLARSKDLGTILPQECWFFRELHRLFGSLCEPDDIGAIGDLVLSPELAQPVREQSLLTFNYLWFEHLVDEKDIIDEHRRLLEQGLAPEDDWKLWMALVVHAAVIGGNKLRPQVTAIIDSGKLAGQTTFVKKIVNGLFSTNSQRFLNMLKEQHKGPFADIEKEIRDLYTPFNPEELEMPEVGKPIHREEPKVGRNDPCPCGSGKKYKKCCGKDK